MELVYIALGLCILITIMMLYSSMKPLKRCDMRRQVDLYYNTPQLKVLDDSRYGGLNDIVASERELPLLQFNTNQQAARWAGSIESQHDNDDSNTRWYTNTDIEVEPMGIQHGLKTINYLKNKAGRSVGTPVYKI